MKYGPPIPRAPWTQMRHRLPLQMLGGAARGFTPPTPVPGLLKGLIPRVPDIDTQYGKDRLRHTTEIISNILNSLIRLGFITQTSPEAWTLTGGGLPGESHTIPLAPLTGGGTVGSITITNGLVTGFVDPT